MRFTADIHIHSHYSRATARNLNLENLSKWAQIKGINVVGTGDFTHPKWFEELSDKLEPAEEGLYKLKKGVGREAQKEVPKACEAPVRFMLTVEISSIYKKGEKTRKVHNIVVAPSLEAALKIQTRLGEIGNIRSDGRPILGLDSRDLLEIVLEAGDGCYIIPAHIWTPHFSALGAVSGFDSIEECFGDLSKHIFALETGLSSDPPMNWRISALDRFTLVSNSDAHSPGKLARECNVLNTDLSYWGILNAWKSGNRKKCLGTLEFFPEEGKYHMGGHRACKVRLTAEDAAKHEGRCPECNRKLTMGVLDRVNDLADRPEGGKPKRTHPFRSIIALPEIIGEVHEVGPNSKRVQRRYQNVLEKLGNELYVILEAPLEDIRRAEGPVLAEAVQRMRTGNVHIDPGYDGVFGKISLFQPGERETIGSQLAVS